MGAREMPQVLVKLTDAAGSCMEVMDAGMGARFLKDYTDALGRPRVVTSAPSAIRIGQVDVAEGGVFAGICRGIDGAPDYRLYLYGEEKEDINFKDALAWAKSIECAGNADYSLPTRREQPILFGNLKEYFKERSYWSCEVHAEDPEWAWVQTFYHGGQDGIHQSDELPARAVRRAPIQPFNS